MHHAACSIRPDPSAQQVAEVYFELAKGRIMYYEASCLSISKLEETESQHRSACETD